MAALALTPPAAQGGTAFLSCLFSQHDHPLSGEVPSFAADEGHLHHKGLSSGLQWEMAEEDCRSIARTLVN